MDAHETSAPPERELESAGPSSEFSYQPDSGGSDDGLIGKQEYGIEVDLDAEARESEDFGTTRKLEDPSAPIPGESNWSQEHRLPEEEPAKNQQRKKQTPKK
jgi:hypothetical protein